MSVSAGVGAAVERVSPLRDPHRPRRLGKVFAWIAGIALVLVVLHVLGVDVGGWLSELWERLSAVPPGYLIGAITLQVAQTTFNGLAYYGILRYAYPGGGVRVWPIVAAYAVGVAMNSFLPANIGTFVTLLMFVALISGSTFAGVFAAYLVNKIFFTVVGALVYVLLFLQAGAAFDVELGWFRDHPLLLLIIVVVGSVLAVVLARIFWRWLRGLWQQAMQGGKILADPRAYAIKVLVPQVLSYAAKVGVIAIFLAAYSIPVTFGSVVHVIGSSSAANVTSVTPGAVGVTQAANAVALREYTTVEAATAYSLSQQLVTYATNVVFALVLVVTVFGWAGGRALVHDSYAGAKEKVHRNRPDADDEGSAEVTSEAGG